MSWSVSVHDHVSDSNGKSTVIPGASYAVDAADQATLTGIHDAAHSTDDSKLKEAVKQKLYGLPGVDLERKAFSANVVAEKERDWQGRPTGGHTWTGHREIRVHTPEGHQLHSTEVEDLMSGRVGHEEMRARVNDRVDANKQREFEGRIHRAMAGGGLPHSGIDTMTMGVPTASSAAGAAITAGFGTPGFTYPRHDGKPVQDRSQHPNRVVDPRT